MASLSWVTVSKIIQPLCGRIARAKHERYPKLEDLISIFIHVLRLWFYLRGWIGKKRPIVELEHNMRPTTVISIGLYGVYRGERNRK